MNHTLQGGLPPLSLSSVPEQRAPVIAAFQMGPHPVSTSDLPVLSATDHLGSSSVSAFCLEKKCCLED